ncbi:hypothetical protein U0355_04765 [Salimicrobium sp. PL1-032A]|uniref:HAAS signaling domain-containing protein n=1 Tax=Salimicrobium sp. PL1-032A TaxID=3095364 RepID=UPI0032617F06
MSEIHTINDYLTQLERKLRDIPTKEREVHLNEIKDHLLEVIAERNVSEKEVLDDFISLEQLSKEILQEERSDEEGTLEPPNYWFAVTVLSVIAPFGALALPLINETIDIGLYLPFLLQFIVGAGVLFSYYNTKMTEKRGEILGKTSRVLIPILAIPFTLFSVSIIQTSMIEMFNIVYLAAYLTVWFISYINIRKLYIKNVKVVLSEA